MVLAGYDGIARWSVVGAFAPDAPATGLSQGRMAPGARFPRKTQPPPRKEPAMNPDEIMRLLQAATVLFTLAALGGLVMAGIRFSGRRNPPAWLAMLHGLLAGAGVTLLAYAWYAGDIPALALLALLLFLLAAACRMRMICGMAEPMASGP